MKSPARNQLPLLLSLALAGLFLLLVAGCGETTSVNTVEQKAPGSQTPDPDGGGTDGGTTDGGGTGGGTTGGGTDGGGGGAPPVDLVTFQAASYVVGQNTFTSSGSATSAAGLFSPFLVGWTSTDGLLITEFQNDRTILFTAVPNSDGSSADLVIGKNNLTTEGCDLTASGICIPSDAQVDPNGTLFSADTGNHRVLVWNAVPTTDGAAADLVLGQADFTSSGGGCSATQLSAPTAVFSNGTVLLVADGNNHRVLIWDPVPTTTQQAADLVLGQGDFSTSCVQNDDDQNTINDGSPTARTMNNPAGIWTDGTILIVADQGNNRVLVWNGFPTSNFEPADIVLGQTSMNGSAANTSAAGLNAPYQVDSNGIHLAVADSGNNRVLIWNDLPTVDAEPPDVVLGQQDFTHGAPNDSDNDGATDGVTGQTLNSPYGVKFADTQLIISDSSNNRVLIYDGQ